MFILKNLKTTDNAVSKAIVVKSFVLIFLFKFIPFLSEAAVATENHSYMLRLRTTTHFLTLNASYLL